MGRRKKGRKRVMVHDVGQGWRIMKEGIKVGRDEELKDMEDEENRLI